MGRVAPKFGCDIIGLSELFTSTPPDVSEAQLQIYDEIPELYMKAHTLVAVRQRPVSNRMADFERFLHILTDG